MHLSIAKLSELTGMHRDSISRRLEDLPFQAGKKGAHLYESSEALPLIFSVDSLEAAQAKQALSQAALNETRLEDLRRRFIPIDDVRAVFDEVREHLMTVLRAAKGTKLTHERINGLFDQFRASLGKLK